MSRLQRFAKLSVSTLAFCSVLPLSGQQTQQLPAHAPDGGTRQILQSIDIPTMPNAPFTAVVVTEWTHIMPDGTVATERNHRTVARDNAGRVFEERRSFTPDGDKRETILSQVEFRDPNLHAMFICNPRLLVCREFSYNRPSALPPLQPVGVVPNGNLTREDLGRKTQGELDLVGTREIMTIAKGVIGNDAPQPVVKELWFAPRLGINVTTRRFDPRASASEIFEVTRINQSEPDPVMLQVPTNYRIIKEQ